RVASARRARRPRTASVASLPECMPLALADDLASSGVAPMMGLDDALTAFEAAAFIGRNWARRDKAPALPSTSVRGSDLHTLTEHDAKQRLKAYGLSVP